MRVTIHQPNYLPWLGFFDKMRSADLFVLLDTVPYTKGGFQNRTRIKGNSGAMWLTAPVLTSGLMGQRTMDTRLSTMQPWRRTHLQSLRSCYSRAPYFDDVFNRLAPLFAARSEYLVEVAIEGIEVIRNALSISTPMLRASDLAATGSSSELLLNIVREAGGTSYLSGPSGRKYLDTELFESAGVSVTYHEYTAPTYPQLFPPFVPGLSALDYLFNVGPGSLNE